MFPGAHVNMLSNTVLLTTDTVQAFEYEICRNSIFISATTEYKSWYNVVGWHLGYGRDNQRIVGSFPGPETIRTPYPYQPHRLRRPLNLLFSVCV